MKKYNILLFDLDDTILDFTKGEKAALSELFEEMHVESVTDFMSDYAVINKSLWTDMENGKIERDYILNNRFYMLFKKHGTEVDGKEIEKKYRYYLDLQHEYIDGAEEILKDLCRDCRVYLITNGVSATQFKRIRDAKLEGSFKEVFVSEDIGYQKPAKEFFEAAIKKIPDFELKKALVIGDSLTADIKGGISAGIDTCWFNPNKIENLTDIKPDYEISSLLEIYNVLSQ